MTTDFTFTATGETGSASTWSESSLAAQILAEINDDANTTGTPPARMTLEVRRAKQDVWYAADWVFKRKKGTITTTADQEYALLPTDFEKFDMAWLGEANESASNSIRITTDSREYQRHKDRYGDSDDTAEPFLGFLLSVSGRWRLYLVSTPDDAYSYDIIYYSTFDSVEVPQWFHELWALAATWRIQKAFRGDDEWIAAKAIFEDALQRALQENNEQIAVPGSECILEGYDDGDLTPTLGMEGADTWPQGSR